MSSMLSAPPSGTVTAERSVPSSSRVHGLLAVAEVRWAVVATVLFTVGGVAQLAGGPVWLWWALYLSCYATGGWGPALAGLRAAREKSLDVDLLMIVAAIVAAAIGQVFDGALLIVIFATSGALEALATKRTADSVRALLDLAPERATRLSDNGSEELVDTAELGIGDLVLVRPGELIGADAVVLNGASEVDQASITGEPLPVFKEGGDEVFAGTLNGTGALRVRVARPASDSVVARIVTLVEEASATKSRNAAVHREDRTAVLGRRGRQHSGVVLHPPGFRCLPANHAVAGDHVHDRRLPVCGGIGYHASAALGNRQRRPARGPGQIRRGDGTARGD